MSQNKNDDICPNLLSTSERFQRLRINTTVTMYYHIVQPVTDEPIDSDKLHSYISLGRNFSISIIF